RRPAPRPSPACSAPRRRARPSPAPHSPPWPRSARPQSSTRAAVLPRGSRGRTRCGLLTAPIDILYVGDRSSRLHEPGTGAVHIDLWMSFAGLIVGVVVGVTGMGGGAL